MRQEGILCQYVIFELCAPLYMQVTVQLEYLPMWLEFSLYPLGNDFPPELGLNDNLVNDNQLKSRPPLYF